MLGRSDRIGCGADLSQASPSSLAFFCGRPAESLAREERGAVAARTSGGAAAAADGDCGGGEGAVAFLRLAAVLRALASSSARKRARISACVNPSVRESSCRARLIG